MSAKNGCGLDACTVEHREPEVHVCGPNAGCTASCFVVIAWDREETDPCEKGTVGCSVAHEETRVKNPALKESECQTW